jgi:hypothetical protein
VSKSEFVHKREGNWVLPSVELNTRTLNSSSPPYLIIHDCSVIRKKTERDHLRLQVTRAVTPYYSPPLAFSPATPFFFLFVIIYCLSLYHYLSLLSLNFPYQFLLPLSRVLPSKGVFTRAKAKPIEKLGLHPSLFPIAPGQSPNLQLSIDSVRLQNMRAAIRLSPCISR